MAVSIQVKDSVCGMTVDAASAAGASERKGETYYFCSLVCKEKFDAHPPQFAGAQRKVKIAAASSGVGNTESLKNADVTSGRRNDHSTPNGAGDGKL